MKICFVVGYFDAFSGYQEVALASSLSKVHDVVVIAGNRVSPIFTDEHLSRLGQSRTYQEGRSTIGDFDVLRLKTVEARSMLLARGVSKVVRDESPDFVVQVMPGQLLPALASSATRDVPSAVLFGDNRAMWASLSRAKAVLKWAGFASTKGLLYKYSVRFADRVFGYTPNTVQRLRPFIGSRHPEVLPLSFNEDSFSYDLELREFQRKHFGFNTNDQVVLLAGKYKREKRFEEAIWGFAEARRVNPRLKLVVAGTSEESLAAVLQTVELNREAIKVLPFLDHGGLNAAFNAADIGIWPAMPAVTIQQAMGTGLYVLLPDNDLVSHLVKRGHTGRSVPGLEKASNEEIAALLVEASCREVPVSRSIVASDNSWLSSSSIARALIDTVK